MSWALVVVQALLFGDAEAPDCRTDPDPIACMIDARFAKDAKAQTNARERYKTSGDLAALGVDEFMDGGFRGKIHLVPELPIGAYRKHLEWIAGTPRRSRRSTCLQMRAARERSRLTRDGRRVLRRRRSDTRLLSARARRALAHDTPG